MALLCATYVLIFVPANRTGASDVNMLSVFELDEFAQFHALWKMTSPRDTADRSRVARVVELEAGARERAVAHLGAAGVEFIDPLPALREAARATRLYAGGVDGHPNGTGYRILAETVAQRVGARVGG